MCSGVGKLPATLVLTVVGGEAGNAPVCLDVGRAFGDCALACCTDGGGVILPEGGGGEVKAGLSGTVWPRAGDLAPLEDIGGGVEGTHISTLEESCASGT